MTDARDFRTVLQWLHQLAPYSIVEWSDLQLSAGSPQASGWVDISVSSPGAPEWSWIWEVVAPSSEAPDDLSIVVEPDWVVDGVPHWMPETLSSALQLWAIEHAKRTDLTFHFSDPGGPTGALGEANMEGYMEQEKPPVYPDDIKVGEIFALHPTGTTPIEADLRLSVGATMRHDFGDGRGSVPGCRLFISGKPPNRTEWLEVGSVFAVRSRSYKVVKFGLRASSPVILKRLT